MEFLTELDNNNSSLTNTSDYDKCNQTMIELENYVLNSETYKEPYFMEFSKDLMEFN